MLLNNFFPTDDKTATDKNFLKKYPLEFYHPLGD